LFFKCPGGCCQCIWRSDNISGDGGGGPFSLDECCISIGGIFFFFFIFHNVVFKLVFYF
jgi:hypothetical protein